jgi:5,10-methylene-tetrahydrofolate dehydrogenase/methenyl tetrahydrofolate cyclohydrolase
VDQLNKDPSVHGIIVQLPFDSEKPIDANKITNLVAPHKDVDGFVSLDLNFRQKL